LRRGDEHQECRKTALIGIGIVGCHVDATPVRHIHFEHRRVHVRIEVIRVFVAAKIIERENKLTTITTKEVGAVSQ
jgi:hypothetical protein